ncbi:gluconokinase [Rhodanobacter sp. Col0626]|uniref:gluconokinase n=1 Tax=Rhodanobacter sp. Col0626 TaxID=3415679 RepID=UPI003CF78526
MIIVVMGVSGTGKSTVGQALAIALGWDFQEGDELHPPSNIDKMQAGIALGDDDRWPWLDRIACWIRGESEQGRSGVVTCSALKRRYRDHLYGAGDDVRFVHIRVPRAELEQRTRHRLHFMPTSLLDSQLQTLEEPTPGENVLAVSGQDTVAEIVASVRHWLDARVTSSGS